MMMMMYDDDDTNIGSTNWHWLPTGMESVRITIDGLLSLSLSLVDN